MKKNIGKILAVILVVALLATVLCACNAESYQKKLEKKGYTVSSAETDKEDASIVWSVSAVKSTTEAVTIYKFKTTDDAEKFEKDAPTGKVGKYSLVVKRTGKIVYYGTEQGVKDAK